MHGELSALLPWCMQHQLKMLITLCTISMQNPFKYPQQMDGLQSALSQLPTAGVYVVGAALVAVLGGSGITAASAVAPGEQFFISQVKLPPHLAG